MNCLSNSRVPDNRCFIKRPCQYQIAIRIKMEGHQFAIMAFKSRMNFAHLHIPKLGSAIHRASGKEDSIWIKGNSHNLAFVPSVGRKQTASDSIPHFSSVVKRTSANFISEGHIKTHAIDCVFMSL